jgi:HAD-hyrolase-like
MIGDRLDNDIRPARLQGWKTMRVLQGFAKFQSPRDEFDEADATVAQLMELLPPIPPAIAELAVVDEGRGRPRHDEGRGNCGRAVLANFPATRENRGEKSIQKRTPMRRSADATHQIRGLRTRPRRTEGKFPPSGREAKRGSMGASREAQNMAVLGPEYVEPGKKVA